MFNTLTKRSGLAWCLIAILSFVQVVAAVDYISFNSSSAGVENKTDLAIGEGLVHVSSNGSDIVNLADGVNVTDVFEDFANTDIVLRGNESVYANLTKKYVGDNDTISEDHPLHKRCLVMHVVGGWLCSWDEYVTIEQGCWWSPWYPISHCGWGNPFRRPISLGWGYSYSCSGFRNDFDDNILRGCLSYPFAKTITRGGTYSCPVDHGKVGQIWYQQNVAYAKIQHRKCSKGLFGNTCSSWSVVQHVDAPRTGDENYRLGCSTGSSSKYC
ncbi:uncharacterized protein KNAG_0C04250 [Huiozyma naganishii CBS 8797]|uniref:Flo11 domain-containing protein n=1 Tax=Huiozyma naganishii (strain ATCC MYA-139 / BCRC 22969 / CBS 8797 / KCTC 17520 / NBRC 10181 / NCYC 3082 / Yp74L-3) TaxID=1071383 RepID=J7RWX9_HUIN7|nr:hypothetical protein KNAG_0C04250 [Kazachstania naganishii CBS 8797]CCK69527.1 hypothetical protein KNAG_0C04250 [Kazachstania naganishii CBS 8797]